MKLLRLEMAKMSLGWYWKAAVLANPVIVGFIFMVCYVEQQEGHAGFSSMSEALIVVGSLVRATFIIMAAVLISKLIIEEYKNKTITLMFMYPIGRKKLLAAKLVLILGLTFISVLISNLLTTSSFIVLNHWISVVPGEPLAVDYPAELIRTAAFAFAAAGTSLIPLYFGMRKHSVPATIISSLCIVALISSHNPVFSLASILYIPLSLAVVGMAIAWWSIRNIERADVL